MGIQGSLRTLRLSGTSGSRSLYSLVANSSSSGGGSTMRIYKYYMSIGETTTAFYNNVLGLQFGAFNNKK
jgi:hypothetical protein